MQKAGLRSPPNRVNNVCVMLPRSSALAALLLVALAAAACAPRVPPPNPNQALLTAANERARMIEERKDEVVRQIAICESGGYGPSDRPIYGGRGAYLGRLQFATRTVIAYVQRRDGIGLNPKDAAALAHDYDRAADLAKYMIFDLEEPWHWPLCAKKANAQSEIQAIKQL
jgi:hypothetical protein